MKKDCRIGIIGATGAVGQEIIRLLVNRKFPCSEIKAYASSRSAGNVLKVDEWEGVVEETTPDVFDDLDIAIFSAGGDTSKALAPEAAKRNCVAIDNSSAFRMDETVPLVVPEINPEAVKEHQGIIANPNCSTAIALMGVYPLHLAFGLKRMFVSTYQAVSGSGVAAMKELENQSKALFSGEKAEASVYPHPIAFNLLPHVDSFLEDGYTREELKMLNEGRKIMNLPDLKVSCTCVRVPVFRAHSMSINAEFEKPVDLEIARNAIQSFSGSELFDNPSKNEYPTPLAYTEKEKCGVGRIRKDHALDNGLALWISGDQLWKGAALNAVQIAEIL